MSPLVVPNVCFPPRWTRVIIWLDSLATLGGRRMEWNLADARNRFSEVVNLAFSRVRKCVESALSRALSRRERGRAFTPADSTDVLRQNRDSQTR
jgi:hypothetical protein